MTDIPKCISRFGHKFEGRYSKGPAHIQPGTPLSIVVDSLSSIYEKFRPVTYERDICVRCGVTVERHIEIIEKKMP